MKTIEGLAQLIDAARSFPETGWIFLTDRASEASGDALLHAVFLLAEDEDEEFQMVDDYPTFLECPIFQDVVELKKRNGAADVHSIAEGCIYYLEYDTFQD